MTITVNTIPFDVKSSSENHVTLQDFSQPAIGAAQLKIAASDPKPTKDFVGMGKSESKLTFRDASGAVTGIYTLQTSVRADVSEADRVSNLATLAALAASQQVEDAVTKGRVPFNG